MMGRSSISLTFTGTTIIIKVDRDKHDVDARYQRAVQALTRQGGWPLTAFLTPVGEVYYGGTYRTAGAHGPRLQFRPCNL